MRSRECSGNERRVFPERMRRCWQTRVGVARCSKREMRRERYREEEAGSAVCAKRERGKGREI